MPKLLIWIATGADVESANDHKSKMADRKIMLAYIDSSQRNLIPNLSKGL